MKKILFILIVSVGFLAVLTGGCGYAGYSVAKDIFDNKLDIRNLKFAAFKWCYNGLPFVDQLEQILDNNKFIVLLQNNYELRPSGGFMGSYAVVSLAKTGLAGVTFQDIYIPDGQMLGHVDPPIPVEQAFGQGWWKLRDSNWDADFSVAAPQILWFFDQGEVHGDGLIALNYSVLQKFLPKDFYEKAQAASEIGSFAGSHQKTNYLSDTGINFLQQIKTASFKQKISLVFDLWQSLKHGEIMLWFSDPDWQKTVVSRHWDGGLNTAIGNFDNYLYVNETNLGANKANCCINRNINLTIDNSEQTLEIDYQNNGIFANPTPPVFWGGDYINFVRVLLPIQAQIENISINGKPLIKTDDFAWQYGKQLGVYTQKTRGDYWELGFWLVNPHQSKDVLKINYKLSPGKRIFIKKQPGLINTQIELKKDNQILVNSAFSSNIEVAY